MIVVPFKAEHMARIQAQDAQRYVGAHVTPEYAHSLEQLPSFAALDGDFVVGVGGYVELWENRALLWSYLDARAGRQFVNVHRVVQRFIETCPHRRLEAEVDCEFEQGHRWLRMLGFTMEAPRMRAFRVDGGDSSLYARVR